MQHASYYNFDIIFDVTRFCNGYMLVAVFN